MTEDWSSVYRGATREAAESAYHADARTRVREGYVPAAEDWSMALGQQVLTVRYVYAPDETAAVLEALASAERAATITVPLSAASVTAPVAVPRNDTRLPTPIKVIGGAVVVGLAIIFLNFPRAPQLGGGSQATQRPATQPASTPGATVKPWTLEVSDAEYTTETVVGGSIFVTLTIENAGKRANPAIEVNFSELDANADLRGCEPECELDDLPGFGPSAVFPGLKPGVTGVYVIEFVAKTVGVVAWNVCVYDDHLLDGDSVYCGDGRTTIR